MSLEPLVQKVLKKKVSVVGRMSKAHRSQQKEFLMAKNGIIGARKLIKYKAN